MQRPSISLRCAGMGPVPFIDEVSSRWRSLRSRWVERFSRRGEVLHLALGRRGERLAARHLRRLGYKVLYRNFRHGDHGEIDLVCRHGEALVFVEVKTRSSEDFGRPVDAVDRKKQRRIRSGAMAWLRMLDMPDLTFRFDVVEIVMTSPLEIRVIESAFHMPSGYYY